MERSRKAKSIFEGYLRKKGFKRTPTRERVLQEILSMGGHFEAEEIARRLRETGGRISAATVYRTLPLLVKAGLIQEVIHGEKHQHYEQVRGEARHDHLICLKCGKITEFRDESLRAAENRVCRENKFLPQKVIIEIFGYCQECRGGPPGARRRKMRRVPVLAPGP